MSTPSNLFINWENFSWTPLPTGAAIVVAKITGAKIDFDGTAETFKGDAAKFAQLIAVPTQMRSIEVDFGDVGTVLTIPIGTPGTVSITLADAVNGITTGGGAKTFTLTPCVAVKRPAGGEHAKFASTSLTFLGYDPTGGLVDPLTVVSV